MLIKVRKKYHLKEHQITDESLFNSRRSVIKGLGFVGAGSLLSSSTNATGFNLFSDDKVKFNTSPLTFSEPPHFQANEELTQETKVLSHNNFYEFGTSKSDPYNKSQQFEVDPWSLTIDGLVETPFTLDYEQLFKRFSLEQRIYRLRCVEAWSMVVPWIGFPLIDLLKHVAPLKKAKYVAFETLYDPKQMPGQRNRLIGGGIDYPYVEGLRVDEAVNPLTFIAVGLYGKTLPPQNGAPVRLVVPWKYGFKSIKSIVRIQLTDRQPVTTWNQLAPKEYGFYANVNPTVAHPRWSQSRERRITRGGLFSQNRIDTELFNGYQEDVAHMYKNMDLHQYY